MTRRRDQPIPPFSRLERAALQALAWELGPDLPQLEGLADEATPDRLYRGPSSFVRRTGMAGVRAGRGRGPSGVFGSVHAMVDGLPQPIAFQLQLRRGRLVALIADAYGQDISGLNLQTTRSDQLFYLDDRGRSHAIDPALFRQRDRSLAKGDQRDVRVGRSTPPIQPPPTVSIQRQTAVPAQAAPTPASAPSSAEQAIASGIDKTTLKIGIWAGLITLAVIIGILSEGSFIFPAIIAFWIGRLLTQPKSLDRIHQALVARQTGQFG